MAEDIGNGGAKDDMMFPSWHPEIYQYHGVKLVKNNDCVSSHIGD